MFAFQIAGVLQYQFQHFAYLVEALVVWVFRTPSEREALTCQVTHVSCLQECFEFRPIFPRTFSLVTLHLPTHTQRRHSRARRTPIASACSRTFRDCTLLPRYHSTKPTRLTHQRASRTTNISSEFACAALFFCTACPAKLTEPLVGTAVRAAKQTCFALWPSMVPSA